MLWVSVMGAGFATGGLANQIFPWAPAQYYSSQLLTGNLESATGLWVSAAQDPLAYIYGYIPGLVQSGEVPFFGSANFEWIPVLLADPLLTLPQLSSILGNTPLPAGGQVLDLTAAGPFSSSLNGAPEPRTIWLAIFGGSALAALCGWQRKRLRELTVDSKQIADG